MKFPIWFKIAWWILLTDCVTWVLLWRYPDLVTGRAAPVHVFFFVVWVALMLVPLFQEVSLLGLKFKQEVEALKSFVAGQVSEIRNEIRNVVGVTTTVSPYISFPTPPPDAQLPELEAKIKKTVEDTLSAHGLKPETIGPAEPEISDDVSFLFATRFAIEKELRRIARSRRIPSADQPVSAFRLSRDLSRRR